MEWTRFSDGLYVDFGSVSDHTFCPLIINNRPMICYGIYDPIYYVLSIGE